MSAWTSAASGVTRSWVAAYTLGLAADVRESRRREIASDLWEQQHDATGSGANPVAVGLHIAWRTLRGLPADVLWRVNVEGPQMDIRIPIERIVGGFMLGMVILMLITAGISGIDTSADGFESYLVAFAEKDSLENNGDAFFRIVTGFALIAGAAILFAGLRDRAPALATIVGFSLLAAAIFELVATGLQIVLVGLADEYVGAPAASQAQLLINARTVALLVETTTGLAMFALLAGIYTLAVLTAREQLVPRWLIGVPVLSAAVLGGSLIGAASGAGDTFMWLALMGGALLAIIWLLIAGLWLIFTPRGESSKAAAAAAGAS